MKCNRKLAFDTVEQAERSAQLISGMRGGEGKVPVRIYECHVCGRLHFTSKEEAAVGSRASTVERLQLAAVPPLSGPPKPPPKPEPAPEEPPKLRTKTREYVLRIEHRLRVTKRDFVWLKNKARLADEALNRGEVDEAHAITSAIVSMPRNVSPTEQPDLAEQRFEELRQNKLNWLRRPKVGDEA